KRGNVTAYTYDSNRRLKSVLEPGPDQARTTYTYDAFGNPETVRDAENRVTTVAYDPAGRVLALTAADGGVATYQYTGYGATTLVTGPANQSGESLQTRTVYNVRGLVDRVDDAYNHPLQQTTLFAYDAAGN